MVLGLIPASVYLVVLALAVILGVKAPAIWIAESILTGPWVYPLLWLVLIGGPAISIAGSLILRLQSGSVHCRARVVGAVGWIILMLCGVTCVPFPWIFIVLAD